MQSMRLWREDRREYAGVWLIIEKQTYEQKNKTFQIS